MKLIVQWIFGIIAIAIAARIVPGITIVGDEWTGLAVAAAMLALVNLVVRPTLTLITLPITVLTLGLFWFVIGGIVLVLASWLSLRLFGAGLLIDGCLSAILGAIVIGIISGLFGFILMRDLQ